MYLTIKQHDLFRTLVMGFEIPFRSYVTHTILSNYPDFNSFENALIAKSSSISVADPISLRQILPSWVGSQNKMQNIYNLFCYSDSCISSDGDILPDSNVPTVGELNVTTFAFTNIFSNLYSLSGSYTDYCLLAEKYRFARNKLEHPGCKTLEERDLVPVLSFVKDICIFLDDQFFIQKSKGDILQEVDNLQNINTTIPISKNNLADIPYLESRIVCRNEEIAKLKNFVYGNPNDLRKRHVCCVFGYGGVGKTALVIELVKEIVQELQEGSYCNYDPHYMFFFTANLKETL